MGDNPYIHNLPQRTPPGEDSFFEVNANIDEWLDKLHSMNPGDSAKELYKALVTVNGLELKVAERFKFMSSVIDDVEMVVGRLVSKYIGAPYPLSSRLQSYFRLVVQFQSEMIIGYKILLNDINQEGALMSTFFHRNMFVTALYQAMDFLSRQLLCSYQTYSPYPENTWKDLHNLYALAVDNHCQTKNIKIHENDKNNSIYNAYKRILMLAIANPYQFSQAEMAKIFESVDVWASYCKILPYKQLDTENPNVYTMSIDDDTQPQLLCFRKSDAKEFLALDMSGLEPILNEEMDKCFLTVTSSKNPFKTKTIKHSLCANEIEKLLNAWCVLWKRDNERSVHQEPVRILMGLTSICRYIDPSVKTQANKSQIEIEEYNEGMGIDYYEKKESKKSMQQEEGELKTLQAELQDESVGGYRIRINKEHLSSEVKVGELIGLIKSGEKAPNALHIGAIRWLKEYDRLSIELGIKLVAHGGVVALVRTCTSSENMPKEKDYGQYMHCMVLPHSAADQSKPTLLAHAYLKAVSVNRRTSILLKYNGVEKPIFFSDMIEQTSSYLHLYFAMDLRKEREQKQAAKTAEKNRRWDDTAADDEVWELL